jgi:hypothetical protein
MGPANFAPQATDMIVVARPTRGNWPAVLRAALRKAGKTGMCREEISCALGCCGDHVPDERKMSKASVDNTIDYLVTVGLAERRGGRLFDVPVKISLRREVA